MRFPIIVLCPNNTLHGKFLPIHHEKYRDATSFYETTMKPYLKIAELTVICASNEDKRSKEFL